eukprot:CAMPEP_0205865414 /NCGR_PEP_ID=MMETSP1083-20121108/7874_1 /ASSEMBLY_ACC=CAM_ASM_000430 /TAXON_ID=97485 /ORGANISM="Prymnesium parvum, Strain Texoma1" /LENGTH=234 /DNA_ID=CAMNT_0053227351 /DNA_START=252 /DNA_END=954 /DNA_ORIENTATION=+
MQHQVVGAWVVVLGALGPVVRHCVREDGAVAVERADGDGHRRLVERLEPLPRVLVPEVVRAVGAGGGERAEGGVEGDAVDGVDVLVLAVALEGEVLGAVVLVDVVDGDAPFDRADAVALLVGEASHTAALVLEGRGDGAVDGRGVGQVDDDHPAVGDAHDEQRVAHVHAVRALGLLEDAEGLGDLPSQYLTVRSHEEVTRQFISCTQKRFFTGCSCAATCVACDVARSHTLAVL